MAIDQETFNVDLYKLLKTRGYNPSPKDAKNQRTQPEAAEVFNFTFKKDGTEYGEAWVTIDNASNLVLYYSNEQEESPSGKSPGLDYDDSWSGLKKHLKQWAMNKQITFELRNKDTLGDDMAQRDYVKKKEKMNEAYHPMGKKASYNDNVPAVKIILQHNRQIEEGEQRYRNIAKIYLENTNGERFLAPTIRPGIAQVYARHIAEGGVPNDDRWNHIKAICEEYSKMAGFVRATRNNQFNESAQQLVTEGINHYQSLRETLGKLRGHRGYNMYFESWTPALMEDDSDQSNINELFVQETLDPRIESVMPILSRLRKKTPPATPVKEVSELAEWADSLEEDPTSKLKMGDKVVCDYTGKPAEVSYILGDKAKISIDGVRQPNYRNIENLKKITSEETALTENLGSFNKIGIPAEFSKNLLKAYDMRNDVEITPISSVPKAKDFREGIVINVLPNGNVIASVRHSGWYIGPSYRRLSYTNGIFEDDYVKNLSTSTKGMSKKGKFFKIEQTWYKSSSRDDKPSNDAKDVQQRTTGDPLSGSNDNIYSYMNKTFMPKLKSKLEGFVDDIYNIIRKLPRDKNSSGSRLSSYDKNQQQVALDAAQAIEEIAERGFSRATMEYFLHTMGKLHHGFGSVPNNERVLRSVLQSDPLARAKWAKTILNAAQYYHAQVKEMLYAPTSKEPVVAEQNKSGEPAQTRFNRELKSSGVDLDASSKFYKDHSDATKKRKQEYIDQGIISPDEVDEGLDKNQKKAGQLGPTEKVGKEGAVGKLVGACESVTAEEGTPEHKVIWNLINGDLDAYDVMNHPKTPAQRKVASMLQLRYDEVSSEYGFHPDDDFENILNKIVDELADDYGTSSDSMNESTEQKWTVTYWVEPKSHDESPSKEYEDGKTVTAATAAEAIAKVKSSVKRAYDFRASKGGKEELDEGQEHLNAIKRLSGR